MALRLVDLTDKIVILNLTLRSGFFNLHSHGTITGRVRFVIGQGGSRIWIGDFCLPPYVEVEDKGEGEYALHFDLADEVGE